MHSHRVLHANEPFGRRRFGPMTGIANSVKGVWIDFSWFTSQRVLRDTLDSTYRDEYMNKYMNSISAE